MTEIFSLIEALPDEEQRKAIREYDRCVILAGPGTGKTYRLVLKLAYLLGKEIYNPQRIACITYMNDAVDEIESRLSDWGLEDSRKLTVATVHKFCITSIILPFKHAFLQKFPDKLHIVSQEKQLELIASTLEQLEFDENEFINQIRLRDWSKKIKAFREGELFGNSISTQSDISYVVSKYLEILRENGFVDFDDISIEACRLVIHEACVRSYLVSIFPWIVIDEYQDLGRVFNALVKSLIDNTTIRFFVVGDVDQSILGFSGAEPIYLDELAKRADTHLVRLTVSWRCLPHILNVSNKLLPNDKPHIESSHKVVIKDGVRIQRCPNGFEQQIEETLTETQRLQRLNIDPGNIGVLCRLNQTVEAIGKVFRLNNISFTSRSEVIYDRTPIIRWLEDLALWTVDGWRTGKPKFQRLHRTYLKYLRQSRFHLQMSMPLQRDKDFFQAIWQKRNPDLVVSEWLYHLVSVLKLDILIEDLSVYEPYDAQAFLSFSEAIFGSGQLTGMTIKDLAMSGRSANSIFLSTLHKSKGLEFDAVIIPGVDNGMIPFHYGQKDEERRLLYVGLTRARRSILLLYSGFTINQYGRKFENGRSTFLDEIVRAQSIE